MKHCEPYTHLTQIMSVFTVNLIHVYFISPLIVGIVGNHIMLAKCVLAHKYRNNSNYGMKKKFSWNPKIS